MANTVKIKHKATAGSSPPSLEPGELAINTADAKLYWEDSSGVIQATYLLPAPSDIGAAPAVSPTFTGVVTVSQGSGSAGSYQPAVVFSGDPNTGIAQIGGADSFSIVTGGAERIRVTSEGRVGVGVPGGVPQAPLHVFASGTSAIFGDGNSAFQFYAVNNGPSKIVTIGAPTSFQIGSGSNIPTEILYGNTAVAKYTNVKATFPGGSVASSVYEPGIAFSADPNTGIGTVTADTLSIITGGSERVRVQDSGAVRFVPMASDPSPGRAGEVYYNSTTNKLRVHNGTSWVDLH